MAFLPTVSLFLLAAAATDDVPADALDTEVEEGVVEEEEEVVEEEESQGEFAVCMKGTAFENMLNADGDGLAASDNCEDSFTAEDCLTFPADGNKCCAYKCNSEHICSGDSFVDVSDEAAGADAADNKVTQCLESNYYPSMWAFWSWTATWKRASYNTCGKVRAAGFAPEDNAEVALCCVPGSGAAEDEAEDETEDEVEGEVEDEGEGEADGEERRLQEDDDEAGDETEDEAGDEAEEADDEAEAEAEGEEAYPKYGAELRDAMCGGTSEPFTPEIKTNEPSEGGDGTTPGTETTSSASTFGFTALALMLVTA